MAEGTHLIVTVEDERGFSAQSPQLPGFVMGRQTEAEFRRDYLEVLRDLGAELPIIGHRQWRYGTPEGAEYLIRLAESHKEARVRVSHQLLTLLSTEARFELLNSAPPTVTGEVLFLCALPPDVLSSISAQLSADLDDSAVLVVPVGDTFLWTAPMGVSTNGGRKGWSSLGKYGLDLSSTVGDVMRALGSDSNRSQLSAAGYSLSSAEDRFMLSA